MKQGNIMPGIVSNCGHKCNVSPVVMIVHFSLDRFMGVWEEKMENWIQQGLLTKQERSKDLGYMQGSVYNDQP